MTIEDHLQTDHRPSRIFIFINFYDVIGPPSCLTRAYKYCRLTLVAVAEVVVVVLAVAEVVLVVVVAVVEVVLAVMLARTN